MGCTRAARPFGSHFGFEKAYCLFRYLQRHYDKRNRYIDPSYINRLRRVVLSCISRNAIALLIRQKGQDEIYENEYSFRDTGPDFWGHLTRNRETSEQW